MPGIVSISQHLQGLLEAAEGPEASILSLDDFFAVPREGAVGHSMGCY